MNLLGIKTKGLGLPLSLGRIKISSSVVLMGIIVMALASFEIFNYSTTEYALRDLLGGLSFAGVRWATILAVAFCGIDFAGIARMFTPEGAGGEEPKEAWYLFGAWMLAALMNAVLTWWGVSMAVMGHTVTSSAVIPAATLSRVVPVFVAVMVWMIRILIIGSLTAAGGRVAAGQVRRPAVGSSGSVLRPNSFRAEGGTVSPVGGVSAASVGPVRSGLTLRPNLRSSRAEPTYHSINGRSETQSTGSGTLQRNV